MTNRAKEVYFEYCNTCVHSKKKEDEEPCSECLYIFEREGTHRPIHYEGDGTLAIKNTALRPATPSASERPGIPLFPATPTAPSRPSIPLTPAIPINSENI